MCVCVCVCVCGGNELEVWTTLAYPHISSFRTMPVLLGGSAKLVCTSECPLSSFAQEVMRGRSVTSGPISE